MTICLNMIVKNEARVIRRCLDSVRPFIDTWAIIDTGSTDGTQEIIRSELAHLPGELVERPWKNFGHNRTEAIELAKGRADYTLIIDADEILVPDTGFRLPTLTADAYQTAHVVGDSGTSFYLYQLVRSALGWRFEGVLHEVLVCDRPHTVEKLGGVLCKGLFDGARNIDPKAKYESDARVLEEALEHEPDNARYVFYLAQSYRDAGRPGDAVRAYQRRVAMGGFPEEVWYSLFQIGVLLETRKGGYAPALEALLRAYQFRPARAEPLHRLAVHYRLTKEYELAYLFARRAHEIPRPKDDIHFCDEGVYAWAALDELSIAEYWTGRYRQSLAHVEELLANPALPPDQRARVLRNREFALRKAGAEQPSATNVAQPRRKKAQRKRRR